MDNWLLDEMASAGREDLAADHVAHYDLEHPDDRMFAKYVLRAVG